MAINVQENTATLSQATEMGLAEGEFNKIINTMGRTPNFTELCIYATMWNTPHSDKNAIAWQKVINEEIDNYSKATKQKGNDLINLGDGLECNFPLLQILFTTQHLRSE